MINVIIIKRKKNRVSSDLLHWTNLLFLCPSKSKYQLSVGIRRIRQLFKIIQKKWKVFPYRPYRPSLPLQAIKYVKELIGCQTQGWIATLKRWLWCRPAGSLTLRASCCICRPRSNRAAPALLRPTSLHWERLWREKPHRGSLGQWPSPVTTTPAPTGSSWGPTFFSTSRTLTNHLGLRLSPRGSWWWRSSNSKEKTSWTLSPPHFRSSSKIARLRGTPLPPLTS